RGAGVGVADGPIRTVTRTTCPSRTRTPGTFGSAIVVVENVAVRPAIDTGSVETPVIFSSAVAGPTTLAIRGSTATSTTIEPGAGSPASAGTIGSKRSPIRSSVTRTSPGAMPSTSTSGGTLMSSGAKWGRGPP